MERRRLLELALKHLQEQKDRIDQELEVVRSELGASSSKSNPGKRTRRKRRKMTPEEREAHSRRMREYWAERKKREQEK